MLELALGFGWVVDLGGTGACYPASSPASLSNGAYHICGVVGCMREGLWFCTPGGSPGLCSVGGGRGLSDGVLIDF